MLKLVERLRKELDDRLEGVYLHGSLATGSYYRPKSDFDMIVVADGKLEAGLAESVGIAIAEEAETRPTVGNVELSVITADTARQVPKAMPYEVHYSTNWHEKIMNREVDYDGERTDPDLLSHLTYVAKRGICLYGKPIREVFSTVEWLHFMESVLDDFTWIVEDDHIVETPFYGVLNICRVLQLTSEDGENVYSKDEGGEWGLSHLPEQFHPIIRQALDMYRSSEPVSEEQRRRGGKEWDEAALHAFRDYAKFIMDRKGRH
ncbi:DUF4111 domain-containing protein [Paenibacillus mesophilus]|uniref:aminoglycoside adenylyltransferase domain-containing protein n=1 Tax=Paenibacillus mesophilus TaxID=2582849 RepID=UPI00110F2A55|nr:aminoglycoside adenylyltransferase domain-containing protein [Paenibacillus mesophilus]TMV46254.1 DUF4111 domain-containing protein [Paenibacillus mesophilus]